MEGQDKTKNDWASGQRLANGRDQKTGNFLHEDDRDTKTTTKPETQCPSGIVTLDLMRRLGTWEGDWMQPSTRTESDYAGKGDGGAKESESTDQTGRGMVRITLFFPYFSATVKTKV